MASRDRVVRFESFRATFKSWQELFAQAAEFATSVGPERLISISHSADQNNGVVTVWYWGSPSGAEFNPEPYEP
ncbi:MAG TPA: hypothetical protein VFY29_18180 [Terriglobia bacterium]|nr:hypothetical protein [Terriglobia bacterium]